MNTFRSLAAAFALACLAAGAAAPAAALTEAEEQQLTSIIENAADASAGAAVGDATITAEGGALLQGDEACTFDRLINAEEGCTVAAVMFPPQGTAIDTIYYLPPEDIGYVDMEEWTEDATGQIDEIWASFVEGARAQSERIGYAVTPLRWVLYPTLNKDTQVMAYGILLDFGGEQVINLHAIKFTRSGYVEMNIVTDEAMLAKADRSFDNVATYASDSYAPSDGFRYADFQDGDKVAAIGAVGVLASVMGVEYTKKGTLAAIGAAILLFAKKFWFVVIAIPAAIWGAVKKFFGRGTPAA